MMKNVATTVVALAATMAFTSAFAQQQQQPRQPMGGAQQQQEQAGLSKEGRQQLTELLQQLHEADAREVQMAQLAQERSQDPQVRSYAKQIQQSHQKLDQQVQQLAQKVGVQLEPAKQEPPKGDIQQQRGMEFDRTFLQQNMESHEKLIGQIEETIGKVQDPQIQKQLVQMGTSLQQHRLQAAAAMATLGQQGQQQQPVRGMEKEGEQQQQPQGGQDQ